VAGSMVALVGLADAEWLNRATDDPAQIARWRLAAELAVWLFPYLIMVCLAAAFSATLQTLGRFLTPALSPIWLNIAMIGFLGGAVWWGGVDVAGDRLRWLCLGVLVGGFFQMVVPAWALMREGWKPRIDLSLSPAVRTILMLMGPTVLGSAIYLINLSVSRLIGLSLNDSAAAILNLATRLIELPIGVFAIAVSTVVFPLIANFAAKADWVNLAKAYHKGMRLVLAVNVPAAVGMVVLAGPIIRVLFQRGEFTADDTAATVPVLAVFAIGLPIFAYVNLMLRAFYAQKDMRTPVRAALLSFVVNVALSLTLMGPFSTMGLALASNFSVLGQAVYLQRALSKTRPELGFGPVLKDVGKILCGSMVMALGVWGGASALSSLGQGFGWDVVRLGLLLPVGAVVYGAVIWSLRLEGREDLRALFRRRSKLAAERTIES
jgi:putative peptidoglycan lipid II flippase